MSQNPLREGGPPSVATLVGEIISDAQKLVRQELALARSELQQEWGKTKSAALVFTLGAITLGISGILLAFAMVHALVAATTLPLWASYLVFGALFCGAGGYFFSRGSKEARDINFVPQGAVESFKENVTWITNQT